MTFYKTVVSWLAVAFLTWRGGWLFSVWLQDKLGTHPIPEVPFIISLLGLRGVTLEEVVPWSAMWLGIALMILCPWLWAIRLKILGVPMRQGLENERSILINTAGRWLFVLAWMAVALDWLPRGAEGFLSINPLVREERFEGYFTSVFASACRGVMMAMLIAPELTQLASSGFTGFIDAVFFPGGREAKPPYTLKLARFYVQKQRFDEAEAEYARMLSFHPEQVEAWQERLALALRRTDEADPAPEEILGASIKALPKAEDREAVHAAFRVRGGY